MSLRGSLEDFPLESVVRMLGQTQKTGRLTVRGTGSDAELGFDGGRLVAATFEGEGGTRALGAALSIGEGDFAFDATPPREHNLDGDIDHLLRSAADERDRIGADRLLIPDMRARFRLSQRAAASGDVTMSAQQWKALLAVGNGADLGEIAAALEIGRLSALGLLADLVRSGVIDVTEDMPTESAPPRDEPEREAIETVQRLVAPEPATPEPTVQEPAAPEPIGSEPVVSAPSPEPPIEAAPTIEPAPSAADDRLAALSGIFGPTAEPPDLAPPAPEVAPVEPAAAAPPMSELTESPSAPVEQPAAVTVDETSEESEAAQKEERKRTGLFGIFRTTESAPPPPAPVTGSDIGKLASLANALLDEYNSGRYGREQIGARMAERLMRVDEQADPIDRALPIHGDQLNIAAIERGEYDARQVLPYLALLVTQIHDDAERVFGRDRAKKGYRAATQRVLGQDASLLAGPDVGRLLPRA